jgi:hypothetical protein
MNLVQGLENMIILPTHTFHALHPLDVSCFVSLKITLKKGQGYNNDWKKIHGVKQDHFGWMGGLGFKPFIHKT